MGKASLTISIGGEYDNKAIARAQADLKNFQIEAARSSSGIASSIVGVGDKLVAAGGKVSSFGNSVSGMGKKLTVAAVPIAALGAAAVKSFTEVEKGSHAVIKATGATGKAAEELVGCYREAAVGVVGSFEDIGSATGELNTRFGFVGRELTSATELTAKYAKVTGTDATQAVQEVASLMNDAGIEAGEYSNVLDMLTVAGQASGISVSKLATSANDNAAALKEMGFSTEASIALLANFEKEGADTTGILAGMKKGVANWAEEGKNADVEFGKFVTGVQDGTVTLADAIEVFGSKAGTTMYDAAKKGQLDFKNMYDAIVNDSSGALDEVYENTLTAQDRMEVASKKIQDRLADTGGVILEKVVPVVEAVCGKIDELAGWFDSLDGSTQDAVVSFGLLAVASGPVLAAGGELISTAGNIVSGVGRMATEFGVWTNSLGVSKTAVDGVSESSKALGTAATAASGGVGKLDSGVRMLDSACKATAIGLVVALVADLVGQLAAYASHEALVSDATAGMTEAIGEAKAAYEGYAPSVSGAAGAMDGAAASAEGCLKAQADLAKTMRDTWSDYGTNAAMVDAYAATIGELAAKGSLSAAEQERLRDAVQGFNEITGESISVVNSQTGELSKQKDAILQVAEAYKVEAEAEAARELYKETTKQLIQDQLALKDATDELAASEEGFGIWLGDFPVVADPASLKHRELRKNVEELTAAEESASETLEQLMGVMASGSGRFETLDSALESCGASMADFGDASSAQLSALRGSFDGSLNSIVRACTENGVRIPSSLASAITANSGLPQDAQRAMFDALVLNMAGGNVEAAATALGRDIDEGLRAGIEGSAAIPEAAIGIMSESVISKAKESFQSSSPSQVMVQLGVDVDAGLANGIDQTASLPIGSMTALNAKMQDQIKGFPDFAKKTGDESGKSLAKHLSSHAGNVGKSASSLCDNAKKGISPMPGDAMATGDASGSNLAAHLGKHAGGVGASSASLLASMRSGVSPMPGDARGTGDASGSNLAASLGRHAANVGGSASSLLSSMKGGIAPMPSMSADTGTASGSNLASSLQKQSRSVKTSGTTLKNSAYNGVMAVKSEFRSVGGEAASGFSRSISSKSAHGSGRKLGSSGVSGLRSGSSGSYRAGTDFASGYANGIGAGGSWVYQRAYGLARRAVAAVSDAQRSSSPSKETFGLGVDFGDGYGDGIRDRYGHVEKRAFGLGERAVEGLRSEPPLQASAPGSSFGKGGVEGKSVTVNIYVDSKKVESGVSRKMDSALAQVVGEAERYANMGGHYGY